MSTSRCRPPWRVCATPGEALVRSAPASAPGAERTPGNPMVRHAPSPPSSDMRQNGPAVIANFRAKAPDNRKSFRFLAICGRPSILCERVAVFHFGRQRGGRNFVMARRRVADILEHAITSPLRTNMSHWAPSRPTGGGGTVHIRPHGGDRAPSRNAGCESSRRTATRAESTVRSCAKGYLEKRDGSDRAGRGSEPSSKSRGNALDLAAGELERCRSAHGTGRSMPAAAGAARRLYSVRPCRRASSTPSVGLFEAVTNSAFGRREPSSFAHRGLPWRQCSARTPPGR